MSLSLQKTQQDDRTITSNVQKDHIQTLTNKVEDAQRFVFPVDAQEVDWYTSKHDD